MLEHGRRFLRVQTDKGEQGWIDEKAVATQEIFDQFEALKQEHKADPTVASAVVRDEVYMHSKPGRDTERFYRLAEGEKLKLLARATLPKPIPPGTRPAKPVAPAPVASANATTAKAAAPVTPAVEEPPAMEDWWLVRDSKGDTGWLLSRMMDVDAPDALTRYAEGQRMVGAYVLTTVNDPEADQENKDIPASWFVTYTGMYLSPDGLRIVDRRENVGPDHALGLGITHQSVGRIDVHHATEQPPCITLGVAHQPPSLPQSPVALQPQVSRSAAFSP